MIVRHGQSEQNACLDLYQDDIDTLLALAAVRDCDIKLTGMEEARREGGRKGEGGVREGRGEDHIEECTEGEEGHRD